MCLTISPEALDSTQASTLRVLARSVAASVMGIMKKVWQLHVITLGQTGYMTIKGSVIDQTMPVGLEGAPEIIMTIEVTSTVALLLAGTWPRSRRLPTAASMPLRRGTTSSSRSPLSLTQDPWLAGLAQT